MKKGARCSGHCCKAFFLPLSPAELEASYKAWLRRDHRPLHMSADESTLKYQGAVEDIHLIAPMVKYLGAFKRPPYKLCQVDDELLQDGEWREPRHFYTCKHYDQKTGDCTIYEFRPAMCRDYPYSSKCNYAECTWTEKKEKVDTKSNRAKRLRVLRSGELMKVKT